MSEVAHASSVIEEAIARSITSIYKELTLDQAHFLTGISPAILRRRCKHDEDWKDVIYLAGSHMRTTLYLISQAQLRSAARAQQKLKTKKPMKKH